MVSQLESEATRIQGRPGVPGTEVWPGTWKDFHRGDCREGGGPVEAWRWREKQVFLVCVVDP